jgi:hypothetical protein
MNTDKRRYSLARHYQIFWGRRDFHAELAVSAFIASYRHSQAFQFSPRLRASA